MGQIEASVVKNIASVFQSEISTAFKIMAGSVALGLICWLPLLVFIAVGPADGNPVGPGVLAMIGTPIAFIGLGAGLIWLLVDLMLIHENKY